MPRLYKPPSVHDHSHALHFIFPGQRQVCAGHPRPKLNYRTEGNTRNGCETASLTGVGLSAFDLAALEVADDGFIRSAFRSGLGWEVDGCR